MVEQLRSAIKLRGLEESGGPQTPLRDFVGKLESWEPVTVQGQSGGYVVVRFNYTELQVLISAIPYTFPHGTIEVSSSTRAQSRWGIFAKSASEKIPPTEELDYLVGRYQRMGFTPGHMLPRRGADGQWSDVATDAWEVVGLNDSASGLAELVSGVGGSGEAGAVVQMAGGAGSARDKAIELLIGSNVTQFNMSALQNDSIKLDSAIVDSIMAKGISAPDASVFIDEVVAEGLVVRGADGVYSKA